MLDPHAPEGTPAAHLVLCAECREADRSSQAPQDGIYHVTWGVEPSRPSPFGVLNSGPLAKTLE